MSETSRIQFGKKEIDYSIRRGQRQKTVAIAVDPIEGVFVRAPKETPIDKLDAIVHRKASWIVQQRRRHEDLPPPPAPREFISGETFLYLGRQYRLKLVREPKVRLMAGYLRVPRVDERRSLLVDWYREHAADWLPRQVEHWTPKFDLSPTDVLIRDQRRRWGSADAKGQLRFNWRLVQAPLRLIDYVVAHELVHLRHKNHTSSFWSELGVVMPDYEDRREELRRLGRMLVW